MSELLRYVTSTKSGAFEVHEFEITQPIRDLLWLSMLLPPTKHSSVYHVISWAEDQERMYNNWEKWLRSLA
jgi:hypothetical protein